MKTNIFCNKKNIVISLVLGSMVIAGVTTAVLSSSIKDIVLNNGFKNNSSYGITLTKDNCHATEFSGGYGFVYGTTALGNQTQFVYSNSSEADDGIICLSNLYGSFGNVYNYPSTGQQAVTGFNTITVTFEGSANLHAFVGVNPNVYGNDTVLSSGVPATFGDGTNLYNYFKIYNNYKNTPITIKKIEIGYTCSCVQVNPTAPTITLSSTSKTINSTESITLPRVSKFETSYNLDLSWRINSSWHFNINHVGGGVALFYLSPRYNH